MSSPSKSLKKKKKDEKMSVTSKQNFSCQMHSIKVHIFHKGFFFQFLKKHKDMVHLTFLMAFLSSSLCISHGLC